MQAAKTWSASAYRPCRPTFRPQRLRTFHGDETSCRYVSHAANRSQQADGTRDEQSFRRLKLRPLILGTAETRIRPRKTLSKIDDSEAIVSDSLAATLEAHREQNASGANVRFVNRGPNPRQEQIDWKKLQKTNGMKKKGASAVLQVTRDTDTLPPKPHTPDYEGQARLLNMEWEIIGEVPRHIRLPWMSALDFAGPSSECAQDRLSTEIQAAGAFLTPRKEEIDAATKVHEELEAYLQKTFRLNLDLIGSRANGLAMPLSDLDFNVRLSPDHKAEAAPHVPEEDGLLQKIFGHMKWGSDAGSVIETSFAAFNARVPIIVGVHVKTGLEVQLQLADGGYGSLETVKGLLAEYPNLRPLFKMLRHMIKLRGLSIGRGKLTSYPLLNMIAVVLKRNPQECAPRHLGLNLFKFLEFWTEEIDLYTTGVTHLPSPYVPGEYGPFDVTEHYFSRKEVALDTISRVVHDPVGAKPALFDVKKDLCEIHEGKTDYQMTLHDPANPRNDLGAHMFQIKDVQATLIYLKQRLKQDMAEWDRVIRTEGQVKTPSLSLLRGFLEGDYTLYNLERKRVVGANGSYPYA